MSEAGGVERVDETRSTAGYHELTATQQETRGRNSGKRNETDTKVSDMNLLAAVNGSWNIETGTRASRRSLSLTPMANIGSLNGASP